MANLKILEPLADGEPLRPGQPLTPVIDIDLDEPWFPVPELGRRLTLLDGELGPSLAFETSGPVCIRAAVSGRAEARDSGFDDHAGQPLRAVHGGRGQELVVRSGQLEIIYGHLKRGSAKTGSVRAGDVVGTSGNTGRCLNGARRSFVSVSARRAGLSARLDDFSTPVVLELRLNGASIGRPQRFPPGESERARWRLDPIAIDAERPEIFRTGENALEVLVRRGARTLAKGESLVRLDVSL